MDPSSMKFMPNLESAAWLLLTIYRYICDFVNVIMMLSLEKSNFADYRCLKILSHLLLAPVTQNAVKTCFLKNVNVKSQL